MGLKEESLKVFCRNEYRRYGPVPVGTDGSVHAVLDDLHRRSRPCGDGWFPSAPFHEDAGGVPSLWGRMVLCNSDYQVLFLGPVPVGTDGSSQQLSLYKLHLSRPCGDGWFFLNSGWRSIYEVPSLWGRMVLYEVGWGKPKHLSRPCGDGWFLF